MAYTKKTSNGVRGRPTKLTQDKIELAIRLRERGFPIKEIAQAIGIDESVLYFKGTEWEQLRQRLNVIKEKQELEKLKKVEHSLYERAIGYKTKEKKEILDADGNLQQTQITTKHIPGDVKAQQFYLTNRDPERWQTTPEENNGEGATDNTIKIVIDDK